jgi:hypothetical protein
MIGKYIIDGKVIRLLNGKRLGVIRKDYTFMAFRKKSKHYFRFYDGWSMNKELLEHLRDFGIKFIEIIDTESNTIYRTSVESFFQKGITYVNTKGIKDEQLILPIQNFMIFKAGERLGRIR